MELRQQNTPSLGHSWLGYEEHNVWVMIVQDWKFLTIFPLNEQKSCWARVGYWNVMGLPTLEPDPELLHLKDILLI